MLRLKVIPSKMTNCPSSSLPWDYWQEPKSLAITGIREIVVIRWVRHIGELHHN
jgi:hypothetical protein